MALIWRRVLAAAIVAASILATASSDATAAERAARDLNVVTYNQYLGADLTPLLVAPAGQFNAALLGVLEEVAANRFPTRARRQAALIARNAPDLVGLQEVWRYRCRDLPPVPGACNSPSIRDAFIDQLPITLDALAALGARYRVAAVVRNFDTADIVLPVDGGELRGLPFAIDGKNGLVLAQDRDVILARIGVATTPVAFPDCRPSVDGCLFNTTLVVPIPAFPGVSVEFKRGFVGVNADLRGRRYRFVSTHLEVEEPDPGNPASMFFQSAQAAQLIATLAALPLQDRELVLVGDLNSAPSDVSPAPGIVPPYQAFAAAGYIDTWRSFRGAAPGFTCCQAADLQNVPSELFKRIDFVLAGTTPVSVRETHRIGEALADRTPANRGLPRLWPSDHAGVAALLRF
jgi:endonuclease/exonuclease/phosphatase family metal-dependent hydrolase